ncbi:MAG: hypothetical protein ABSD41_07950 [Candidatus Bathyarchaeia archaeon]
MTLTNDRSVAHALKSCGYFQRGSAQLIVRSLTSRILGGICSQSIAPMTVYAMRLGFLSQQCPK